MNHKCWDKRSSNYQSWNNILIPRWSPCGQLKWPDLKELVWLWSLSFVFYLPRVLPISYKCRSLVSKERGRRKSSSQLGVPRSKAHTSASLEWPAGLVYHQSVVLKLPDSHWLGMELLWKLLTSGSHLRQCALIECVARPGRWKEIKRGGYGSIIFINKKIFFQLLQSAKTMAFIYFRWNRLTFCCILWLHNCKIFFDRLTIFKDIIWRVDYYVSLPNWSFHTHQVPSPWIVPSKDPI